MSDIQPLGISPDLDPDDLASIGTGASARHVDPRDVPQPNTWAPEHGDLPSESPFRQPARGPVRVAEPIQVMPGAYRVLAAETREFSAAGPSVRLGLTPSRVQQAQHVAYTLVCISAPDATTLASVRLSGDESALAGMRCNLSVVGGGHIQLDGLPGVIVTPVTGCTVGVLVVGQ